MKMQVIDGVEVQYSSGNVYADLGLPDADELKIKTGFVIEIMEAMQRLALTQQVAANRMGITQSKILELMQGDFSNFTERKLIDGLSRFEHE